MQQLPEVRTSLQIPPANMEDCFRALELEVTRAFSRGLDAASIKKVIDATAGAIVNSMPPELRSELARGEIEELKNKIKAVLLAAARECMAKKAVTPSDIQNLIARIVSFFMGRHANALVNNRALDRKTLPAGYNPAITNEYLSLATQRATAVVIWFISTFTSWMGLTHYCGMGFNYLSDTLKLGIPGGAILGLRHTLAIGGSIVVSQMVQKFKESIEAVAHTENQGAFGSAIDVAMKSVRKNLAFFLVAAAVVTFDVATNINGFVTAVLQRHSKAAQIESARKEVSTRKRAIDAQHGKAKAFPAEVGAQIKEILEKEAEGTSETGKKGEGPVFDAKQCLYLEEECDDGGAAAAGNGDLRPALQAEVKKTGLTGDGKTMEQETEKKVSEQLIQLDAILSQINVLSASLDPSSEIETLNADLENIVDFIGKAAAILNTDLPRGLEVHFKKYQEVGARIVSLAQKSGKYPNIKPDKLKKWELPAIQVDTSRIEIERIKYVGFEDLLPVMNSRMNGPQMLMFMLLALLIGYLSSYADLLTLSYSRKGYARDRRERDEKTRNYFEPMFNKVVAVVAAVLNTGPYSKFYKPGTTVNPKIIEQAVRERVDELAQAARPQQGRAFSFLNKFFPIAFFSKAIRSKTDVAIDHNACVGALGRIISNPAEIGEIMRRLLPGMRVMDQPRNNETLANARDLNDRTVTEANDKVQAGEIKELRSAINALKSGIGGIDSFDDMDEAESKLRFLRGKLNRISLLNLNEANRKELDEANKDLDKLQLSLNVVCIDVVNNAANNTHVQNTMPDNELAEILELCDLWQKRLNEIPQENMPQLPPASQSLYLSLVGIINDKRTEVDTIRSTRRAEFEEARRLAEQQQISDRIRATVDSVEGWYAARTASAADNSLTARRFKAENLAVLLGQRNVIGYRGVIENAELCRSLETSFENMQNRLDLAVTDAEQHGNESAAREMGVSKAALDRDMNILRQFYNSH